MTKTPINHASTLIIVLITVTCLLLGSCSKTTKTLNVRSSSNHEGDSADKSIDVIEPIHELNTKCAIQDLQNCKFPVGSWAKPKSLLEPQSVTPPMEIGIDINSNGYLIWQYELKIWGIDFSRENGWGSPTQLSGSGTRGELASVLVQSDGSGVVSYKMDAGALSQVYARVLDLPNKSVGEPVMVNNAETSGNYAIPATDSDGNSVIVWKTNKPDSSESLAYRMLFKSGRLGEVSQLNVALEPFANVSLMSLDAEFALIYTDATTIQQITISSKGTASAPKEIYKSAANSKIYGISVSKNSKNAAICWTETQQVYCTRYESDDPTLKPVKLCEKNCYTAIPRAGKNAIYIVSRSFDENLKITYTIYSWDEMKSAFVEIDLFNNVGSCSISNVNVNNFAILYCGSETPQWKFVGEKLFRTFDSTELSYVSSYLGSAITINDVNSALLMYYSSKTSLIYVTSFFPN